MASHNSSNKEIPENTPQDAPQNTPDSSLDRREFMKLFGRIAVYTPPSVALLMDSGGELALQSAEASPGPGEAEEPMSLKLEGFTVK